MESSRVWKERQKGCVCCAVTKKGEFTGVLLMGYKRGEVVAELIRALKDPTDTPSGYDAARTFIRSAKTTEALGESPNYFLWSAKLFEAGTQLEQEGEELLLQAQCEPSGICGRLGSLNQHMNKVMAAMRSLCEFEADVREFQNSFLATDEMFKGPYLQALSDLADSLGSKLNMAFEITNRKMGEVWAARMTAANLFLGSLAAFAAIVALVR